MDYVGVLKLEDVTFPENHNFTVHDLLMSKNIIAKAEESFESKVCLPFYLHLSLFTHHLPPKAYLPKCVPTYI